jgi:hypothetical protein
MYWRHNDKNDQERVRKENLERLGKEDLEELRKEGFTEQAIAQLYQLRSTYGQDEMDQVPLDKRRLEFARWLVATGRLTDQIK